MLSPDSPEESKDRERISIGSVEQEKNIFFVVFLSGLRIGVFIFTQRYAGCLNWYFYEHMFSVIRCNIYSVPTVGTNDNYPKVLVC